MPDKAYLIDIVTGKIVDVTEECKQSTDFFWHEGNMACDCNRATYFDEEEVCGEGRYLLVETLNFPWKELEDV